MNRTVCMLWKALFMITRSLIFQSILARSMTSMNIHSGSSSGNSVRLNYVCNEKAGAAAVGEGVNVVLIHGLDSSSHTWKRTLDSLDNLGVSALAIDCRGCGRSELGATNLFSPDALVEDLHQLLFASKDTNDNKLVLVGHSMGGRIAMSYAAKYPQHLMALVIEDMDIDRRTNNPFPASDVDSVLQFDRDLKTNSEEKVLDIFAQSAGYPQSMVQRWIKEGRIYLKAPNKDDTDSTACFWSDVNPAFRHLCYQHFCFTDEGEQSWKKIAASSSKFSIPCHVMVASKDNTICRPESIRKMQQIMGDELMTLYNYPDATHSIHNSAHSKFLSDLTQIIKPT